VPESWEVTIICHPPAGDDMALHRLESVYRMRITLTGTFRQVWFDSVQAMERPLLEAGVGPAPSPPPPMPGHPPATPPPPPDATAPVSPPPAVACTHNANTWVAATVSYRLTHEPCGQTKEECCAHMQDNEAGAYQIDDAGCCDLIYFDAGVLLSGVAVTVDASRDGAYLVTSGTGSE
jgi:hypothetical protein